VGQSLGSVFEDMINRYFEHLIRGILKVVLSDELRCIREKTFVVTDFEVTDGTGNGAIRMLLDFKSQTDLGFVFGILFIVGWNIFVHNF